MATGRRVVVDVGRTVTHVVSAATVNTATMAMHGGKIPSAALALATPAQAAASALVDRVWGDVELVQQRFRTVVVTVE